MSNDLTVNPLSPFLTGIANAIRYRKTTIYEEVIASSHLSINNLMTDKTNIGSTNGSAFETLLMGFASNDQIVVLVSLVDTSNNPYVIILSKDVTGSDLSASDIVLGTYHDSTYNADFVQITNNTSSNVNYVYYELDANSKWGSASGTPGGYISSNGTLNTGKCYVGNPFQNTVRVPISNYQSIPAPDFADEIRNLPAGGSVLGDLVISAPFTLTSGQSQRPGPYDSDGYNYDPSIITPSATNSVSKTLTKNLQGYTTMSIIWDKDGSTNPYGDLWSKVTVGNQLVTLYQDENSTTSDINGDVITTIDISEIGNVQSVTFTNYAYTRSSYRGYISEAVTNVKGIYVK